MSPRLPHRAAVEDSPPDAGVRLRLDNAGFGFSADRWLFRNVDLTLRAGDVLTVLGRNGAGKSTLLNMLLGLLEPTEGAVHLGGAPCADLAPSERARLVAYVRQASEARVNYPVRDYLLMGRTPFMNTFQRPGAADRQRVESVMADVGIAQFAERPLDELSGGERQRVDIARALVQDAPTIVMDEPTSALDLGNQVGVLRKVRELAGQGYCIVLTTHDPNQAFALGGQVAVLDGSGAVSIGDVDEVLTGEFLSALFRTPLQVRWDPRLRRHSSVIASAL